MTLMKELIDSFNKSAKANIASYGIQDIIIERIPFSSPRLNYATYGGIPRARMSMFAGKESSGKTTTALDIIRNAQIIFKEEYKQELAQLKADLKACGEKKTSKRVQLEADLQALKARGHKKVAVFDAEGTIEANWSSRLKFDINDIIHVRLGGLTAEKFLDMVVESIRSADDLGLVIIDSIAVLVSQQTLNESLEQKSMGGNAKVVTDFVAKISPLLSAKDITCIVINQARDDFKNPYADFAIPCGNSLKHACSMILVFQKGKFFDETLAEKPNSIDSPVGNIVMVRVQKTKVCKPDRRIGYYTLTYDDGIDVITDVIPVAVSYGLLDKGGSWYRITDGNGSYLTDAKGDVLKFQGMAQLHAFLKETPDVLNFMLEYINEQIVKDGISPALQISQEMDDSAFKDGVLNLAGETDEE
jgi:recombination protein RecA